MYEVYKLETTKFEQIKRIIVNKAVSILIIEDTEIIIEVTPKFVEIWDTSEDNYAFQIFIDFDKRTVDVKQYDNQ